MEQNTLRALQARPKRHRFHPEHHNRHVLPDPALSLRCSSSQEPEKELPLPAPRLRHVIVLPPRVPSKARVFVLFLPPDLVSLCMDPTQFVIDPGTCARVETLQDWTARVGGSTALDSACRDDLTDLTSCSSCVEAGYRATTNLTAIDDSGTREGDRWLLAEEFHREAGLVFVYRGILSDGSVVAVKRILESDFQGDKVFCNEVEIISNLKHWNLVPYRIQPHWNGWYKVLQPFILLENFQLSRKRKSYVK